MPEKLSETTWTAFTKKLKLSLDDAPLVKALARLDKTSETKPEPRLEALDGLAEEIKKQVTALARRKKELGDKLFGEVKDKLYALLDSAEQSHKEMRKAVDAARGEADADEDSPALLTTKLVPLLRDVRKGELVLQALVAVAGQDAVVLLSRRAISPAQGKLLKDRLQNPAGLKFIRGECLFENNAVTFVVQAKAAGLAKKINAALLAQTELRLKVRVRGEDPGDLDEEGDDGGKGPQEAPAAPAASAAPAPAAPADALKARFEQRLDGLTPRLVVALKEGRGDVAKLKAVSTLARDKAKAGAFAAGLQALDALEKLLSAGAGAAPAAAAIQGAGDAMAQWKEKRAAVLVSLKAVASKIASAKHPSSAKAILEIQAVMKNLTAEPSTGQQITELQNYLKSDDVVHDVSELAEDIRTPLLGALTRLRESLVA